jgi:hypothetical protein
MAYLEYDIPEGNFNPNHLPNADLVSSIGSVAWPPEKASFERKKGFVGDVIDDPSALSVVMEQFAATPFDAETSRICGRMVVNKSLIDTLRAYGDFIETIVDLEGSGAGVNDCVLVYVGNNDSLRVSPNNIMEYKQFVTQLTIPSKCQIQSILLLDCYQKNKKRPKKY